MIMELSVGRFDHGSLHRATNLVVAVEDLYGRNVLQLAPLSLLRKLLIIPQK